MSPNKRRKILGWCGAFFREAAVLVAVFAPLEALLEGHPLSPLAAGTILGVAVLLLAAGMWIGLEGDDDD